MSARARRSSRMGRRVLCIAVCVAKSKSLDKRNRSANSAGRQLESLPGTLLPNNNLRPEIVTATSFCWERGDVASCALTRAQ